MSYGVCSLNKITFENFHQHRINKRRTITERKKGGRGEEVDERAVRPYVVFVRVKARYEKEGESRENVIDFLGTDFVMSFKPSTDNFNLFSYYLSNSLRVRVAPPPTPPHRLPRKLFLFCRFSRNLQLKLFRNDVKFAVSTCSSSWLEGQ